MFSPLFFQQGSIIGFERFQLYVSPALHIYVVCRLNETFFKIKLGKKCVYKGKRCVQKQYALIHYR